METAIAQLRSATGQSDLPAGHRGVSDGRARTCRPGGTPDLFLPTSLSLSLSLSLSFTLFHSLFRPTGTENRQRKLLMESLHCWLMLQLNVPRASGSDGGLSTTTGPRRGRPLLARYRSSSRFYRVIASTEASFTWICWIFRWIKLIPICFHSVCLFIKKQGTVLACAASRVRLK